MIHICKENTASLMKLCMIVCLPLGVVALSWAELQHVIDQMEYQVGFQPSGVLWSILDYTVNKLLTCVVIFGSFIKQHW